MNLSICNTHSNVFSNGQFANTSSSMKPTRAPIYDSMLFLEFIKKKKNENAVSRDAQCKGFWSCMNFSFM